MESVEQFAAWLQSLPPFGVYLALLAIAYGENLLPPVPGDVAVVVGGSLVGLGLIDFIPAVGVATLGGALGFMTMYTLGYALGNAVEDPHRLRWIPRGPVRTAKGWLQRWGYGVVAANRFLSGARSVIALLAGASDLRALPTAACATLSAAVWTTLLTYAGYVVGTEWERVLGWLRAYGRVISGVLVVLAVGFAVRWWVRRKRAKGTGKAASPNPQRNQEDPP